METLRKGIVICNGHILTRLSMKTSDFQRHSVNIRNSLTTIVFLDPPKKIHVTLVGYSWNNQGIFLYSVFPEHYFGIFPGISYGNFSKYSGNISWECSTNIPRTYICPVGHSFRIVLDESLETLRKLCLSTTFPHQEIRWNYGILRSAIITIFV